MNGNDAPSIQELWTAMQEQREQIARLEARVEEQQQEKLALARRLREVAGDQAPRKPRVSRAGLIKAAAVGAIGLAGVESLRPQAALAAGTDGAIDIGYSNTTGQNGSPNGETKLSASSGFSGSTVLRLDASNLGSSPNVGGLEGYGSGSASGIAGYGGPNGGHGLRGQGGPGENLSAGGDGAYLIGGNGAITTIGGSGVAATGGAGAGAGVTATGGPAANGFAGGYDVAATGGTGGGSGVAATGGAGLGSGILASGGPAGGGLPAGDGVLASSGDGTRSGVVGIQGALLPPNGASGGVMGLTDQTGGNGMYAYAPNGVGLYAQSQTGFGVHAIGFPGFLAEGATVNGAHGRGGRFVSEQAQIRLNPASAATPPSSGQAAGDFFAASDGGLYYCKDGTHWVKIV